MLRAVDAWLQARAVPAAQRGTVTLSLAEALNNIVEHACAACPDAGLTVRCRLSETEIRIELVDQGRPMTGGCVPRARKPAVTVPRPDLPEGGFGWFLIQDLAETISYARRGGENHLHMTFPRGTDGSPQE